VIEFVRRFGLLGDSNPTQTGSRTMAGVEAADGEGRA
jgi:hypothetical protein